MQEKQEIVILFNVVFNTGSLGSNPKCSTMTERFSLAVKYAISFELRARHDQLDAKNMKDIRTRYSTSRISTTARCPGFPPQTAGRIVFLSRASEIYPPSYCFQAFSLSVKTREDSHKVSARRIAIFHRGGNPYRANLTTSLFNPRRKEIDIC